MQVYSTITSTLDSPLGLQRFSKPTDSGQLPNYLQFQSVILVCSVLRFMFHTIVALSTHVNLVLPNLR